ncbi:hypothetical protein GGS20DRAFT_201246 [Poronia punctata]|nr:hypothetical protein GGS20DRAFT_201246 [Poronia punctata]
MPTSKSPRSEQRAVNRQQSHQFLPAPSTRYQEFARLIHADHHTASTSKHTGTEKRRSSMPKPTKKPLKSVSHAIRKAKNAVANFVSHEQAGTEAWERDIQKAEIEQTIQNDPGPWHEYSRLDSDADTIHVPDTRRYTTTGHSFDADHIIHLGDSRPKGFQKVKEELKEFYWKLKMPAKKRLSVKPEAYNLFRFPPDQGQ